MYRIEKDSIGEKQVPSTAYYGVHSLRAYENFNITGQKLYPEFIDSIVIIKKACALVNKEEGMLDSSKADAITSACDYILSGHLTEEFITDPIQGGAGTSMNMNANEVIANKAIEILGGVKGDYSIVHPNDHVNFGQSTNDVIPSAGKLTCIRLIDILEDELRSLFVALLDKSTAFKDIIKMGRTQLQDAVPITLGQEFFAYADAVRRCIERLDKTKDELYTLNMGGTAIGTGLNTDPEFYTKIVPKIAELTELPLTQPDNVIDSTQNIDCFSAVSGSLKSCAMALSKIANDLRLLSSGPRTGIGEIVLPPRQNGSSIMPGKINPVIPEVLNQVCFMVAGNDVTVAMAVEAGQLELNVFEPVIFYCLFGSLKMLANAVHTFRVNCIEGILADEARCKENLDRSVGMVTALCPYIGYAKAAEIAKESLKTNVPVKELVLKQGLLSEQKLNAILDPSEMTTPGIAGAED